MLRTLKSIGWMTTGLAAVSADIYLSFQRLSVWPGSVMLIIGIIMFFSVSWPALVWLGLAEELPASFKELFVKLYLTMIGAGLAVYYAATWLPPLIHHIVLTAGMGLGIMLALIFYSVDALHRADIRRNPKLVLRL